MRVFQQRPAGVGDRGGFVGAPAAADLVESLGRPRHDPGYELLTATAARLQIISRGLAEGLPCKEIALQVGRNPSVISREVATPQPPWRLPAVTAGTAACAARERPKVYAVERSPRGRSARTSSVAPPVVRHSQQALDFMTGVRQGFQKGPPNQPYSNPGPTKDQLSRSAPVRSFTVCPTSGKGRLSSRSRPCR